MTAATVYAGPWAIPEQYQPRSSISKGTLGKSFGNAAGGLWNGIKSVARKLLAPVRWFENKFPLSYKFMSAAAPGIALSMGTRFAVQAGLAAYDSFGAAATFGITTVATSFTMAGYKTYREYAEKVAQQEGVDSPAFKDIMREMRRAGFTRVAKDFGVNTFKSLPISGALMSSYETIKSIRSDYRAQFNDETGLKPSLWRAAFNKKNGLKALGAVGGIVGGGMWGNTMLNFAEAQDYWNMDETAGKIWRETLGSKSAGAVEFSGQFETDYPQIDAAEANQIRFTSAVENDVVTGAAGNDVLGTDAVSTQDAIRNFVSEKWKSVSSWLGSLGAQEPHMATVKIPPYEVVDSGITPPPLVTDVPPSVEDALPPAEPDSVEPQLSTDAPQEAPADVPDAAADNAADNAADVEKTAPADEQNQAAEKPAENPAPQTQDAAQSDVVEDHDAAVDDVAQQNTSEATVSENQDDEPAASPPAEDIKPDTTDSAPADTQDSTPADEPVDQQDAAAAPADEPVQAENNEPEKPAEDPAPQTQDAAQSDVVEDHDAAVDKAAQQNTSEAEKEMMAQYAQDDANWKGETEDHDAAVDNAAQQNTSEATASENQNDADHSGETNAVVVEKSLPDLSHLPALEQLEKLAELHDLNEQARGIVEMAQKEILGGPALQAQNDAGIGLLNGVYGFPQMPEMGLQLLEKAAYDWHPKAIEDYLYVLEHGAKGIAPVDSEALMEAAHKFSGGSDEARELMERLVAKGVALPEAEIFDSAADNNNAPSTQKIEVEDLPPPVEKYIVQKGDTLSEIAEKLGVDTDELAAANGIEDKNKIGIGQELKLPTETAQTPDVSLETVKPEAEAPKADVSGDASPEDEPSEQSYTPEGESVNEKAAPVTDAVDQQDAEQPADNPAQAENNEPEKPAEDPAPQTQDVVQSDVVEDHDAAVDNAAQQNTSEATVSDTQETTEAKPEKYIVQKGDTLSEIAEKLGVDTDELAAANGIEDKNKIGIGQELKLPTETVQDIDVKTPDAAPEAAKPEAVAPAQETPKADTSGDATPVEQKTTETAADAENTWPSCDDIRSEKGTYDKSCTYQFSLTGGGDHEIPVYNLDRMPLTQDQMITLVDEYLKSEGLDTLALAQENRANDNFGPLQPIPDHILQGMADNDNIPPQIAEVPENTPRQVMPGLY